MNFPFLAIIFFLSLFWFCNAEVSKWETEFGHFNPTDGTCKVNDRILAHKNPPKPVSPVCNDPLFTLFKFCAKKHFYNEGSSQPKGKYSDSVLYLLNGCLQCPVGNAQANVRLLNRLPSGPLFSGCHEEEITLASATVHLTSSGRKYSESDGTFGIGAILDGRDCGVFGSEKETEFNGILLEVEHNCGRKKPMILRVKMPPVIVDLIRERGNYREWDGISLDLSIKGFGWDEQWVDFGKVRPSDFRRHQAQKKPMEQQMIPPKKNIEENVVADEPIEEKEDKNAVPAAKNDAPTNSKPSSKAPILEFVDNEKGGQNPQKEEEWKGNEREGLTIATKLLLLIGALIGTILICICCSKFWLMSICNQKMEKGMKNVEEGNGGK